MTSVTPGVLASRLGDALDTRTVQDLWWNRHRTQRRLPEWQLPPPRLSELRRWLRGQSQAEIGRVSREEPDIMLFDKGGSITSIEIKNRGGWTSTSVGFPTTGAGEVVALLELSAHQHGHRMWLYLEKPPRSYFMRIKEYVGRVRDIDHETRTFTAILGGRRADPSQELTATFDRRLVGDREFERLRIGSTFTLVTGYRVHVAENGTTLSSALDTRIVMHRRRPRSPEQQSAALAEASELLED